MAPAAASYAPGSPIERTPAASARPNQALAAYWMQPEGFDPAALRAFTLHYPKAEHFVVAHDVDRAVSRRYGELKVTFIGLESLVKEPAASK